MSDSSVNTSFDPNSVRRVIAVNAFHFVLSSIDPNLPIEMQVELIDKIPEGRFYDVPEIESLAEFQSHFILDQYQNVIKEKLFAAFPTFEDKMAHALSAKAISSIPDASVLDYDKQYGFIKNDYRKKILDFFFDKSMINLTITPQDTAVNAILLRSSIKQYCADINSPSKTAAIISGAVDKFLPNVVELKKAGLSSLLYSALLDEFNSLYISYSVNRVIYPQNTPGLSDTTALTKIKDAFEKLKNAPDLPDNYLSTIKMMMDTSENVSNKNSNPGCLGILILLLTLVPTLTYAASKLIF